MLRNVFSLTHALFRLLRPARKGRLRPVVAGATVLYAQFERPLGCCIHGTPLIEALKAIGPGVQVVVATCGPGAATLRHHPGVDHLIELDTDPLGSSLGLWRAAQELRARLRKSNIVPDAVVQDASSRRGTWALFSALLRLAPTVGFAAAPQLYDVHLPYAPGLSLIDNNLRVIGALGGSNAHREPAVFFNGCDLEKARLLLSRCSASRKGLIAFVQQGSGGQATRWLDERFAAVIRELEAAGYASVFLGTVADADGVERVRRQAASSGLSLAGETSIPEAAAVLCLCDLLISVDTGTMHLGRAVGVPMVVLGPSWQRPLEWLPLGLEQVRILRGPDQEQAPPDYHLDEISVAEVLAASAELFSLYPPAAAAREARVRARLAGSRDRGSAR